MASSRCALRGRGRAAARPPFTRLPARIQPFEDRVLRFGGALGGETRRALQHEVDLVDEISSPLTWRRTCVAVLPLLPRGERDGDEGARDQCQGSRTGSRYGTVGAGGLAIASLEKMRRGVYRPRAPTGADCVRLLLFDVDIEQPRGGPFVRRFRRDAGEVRRPRRRCPGRRASWPIRWARDGATENPPCSHHRSGGSFGEFEAVFADGVVRERV